MRLRLAFFASALALASTLATLVRAEEATPESKELARQRYQQGA